MLATLTSATSYGTICADGGIAQLGERLLCKQKVRGSSPLISTFSSIRFLRCLKPKSAFFLVFEFSLFL